MKDFLIYGEISNLTFELSELRKAIVECESNGTDLRVRLDSYGGNADYGLQAAQLLAAAKCNTIGIIDGMAASAASLIFAACKKRVVFEASRLMMHNPWTYLDGDATKLQEVASELASLENSYKAFYSSSFGIDQTELQTLMDKEVFLSGKDIAERGWAEFSNSLNAIYKPKQNNMSVHPDEGMIAKIVNSTFKAFVKKFTTLARVDGVLSDGTKVFVESEWREGEVLKFTETDELAPAGTHLVVMGEKRYTVVVGEGGVITSIQEIEIEDKMTPEQASALASKVAEEILAKATVEFDKKLAAVKADYEVKILAAKQGAEFRADQNPNGSGNSFLPKDYLFASLPDDYFLSPAEKRKKSAQKLN